jgi:diguanylate cyclase (GGDEF)-like protein
MQVSSSGEITSSPITDTFELTEIVRLLTDFITHGADPKAARYLARKAMATSELAAWRIQEQSRRIAALERESVTDTLTGLINRRGFERELGHALSASQRHDETGAMIYIDLDDFKATNDTYGHNAGDVVLKHVASILHNNVRDTDRVARLGGDEFAVLMSRTSLKDAKNRTRVIEQSLNQAAIDWQDTIIPIQASLGTEVFGANDEEVAIIHRADQAMYTTKRIRAEVPVIVPAPAHRTPANDEIHIPSTKKPPLPSPTGPSPLNGGKGPHFSGGFGFC